jgi:hypothetical protein
MSEKTMQDRRHELKMLVYGFILTTIVGGFLAFLYQYIQENQKIKAEKRQEEINIMEQRREQATALFNEISPLIDTRLYDWRRLAWGLEDRIHEDSLKSRYAEYIQVFYSWNHNLNKNRALICRFFGPELGGQFEEIIMPKFRELHESIIGLYRIPRSSRPLIPTDNLNSLADSLNDVIYTFNNAMAELIRSGKVGLTDPGKACDISETNTTNQGD